MPVTRAPWPSALLILVALALVPAAPRAAGAAPAEAPIVDCVAHGAWLAARTRHVLLYTNAPADQAQACAREFALFAWLLGEASPGIADDGGAPVIAFGFQDAGCYDPFRMSFDGKPVTGPGHFVSGPLGGMIVFQMTSKPEDLRVLHHEYLHAFTAQSMGQSPVCLREGMAELYSTFHFTNGTAEFGNAIPGRCWVLQHGEPLTLDQLFGIGRGAEYYSGPARDMLYAESWALVHDLLQRHTSAKLDDFLRDVSAGADPQTAFLRAFPGDSWADVPQRLRTEFADCEVDPIVIPTHAEFAGDSVVVRAVSTAEIETAIGDLLVQEGRLGADGAQAYYNAALRAEPGRAAAYLGFGMVNSALGFRAAARAQYAQALARPGLDSVHLSWAAMDLAHDAATDTTLADSSAVRADRLRDAGVLAERALAAEPPSPSAVAVYGAAALLDSAFAARVEPRLARLHAHWPRRADVALGLVQAELTRGACAAADSVFGEASFRGTSDQQLDALRWKLCTCYLESAPGLANSGRAEDAEAALTRARALANTSQLSAMVEDEVKRFHDVRIRNSAVDAYNKGVELARAGQVDGAIAQFDYVHEHAQDAELALQAGQQADRLRKWRAQHAGPVRKR